MTGSRNPVAKALWFIESHLSEAITLTQIADVAGVSRFHMLRAFGVTTGHSVMRYVRGRRLTEAARALAHGAPDILWVALESGYGSHEAFARAFRDQFGVTPGQVRAAGCLNRLSLIEACGMEEITKTPLNPPRMADGRTMLVAGLQERFTFENTTGIPALWQRVRPHLGHVPKQVGQGAYGVCHNTDETGAFDYIAGVEVADFASLPPDFARLRIAAQRYVVFSHTAHVSAVKGTYVSIFSDWLPTSGHQVAEGPQFEKHDDRFDPKTGMGGFEIWIPLKRRE